MVNVWSVPYEKDRIIADQLGQTELGRDMLAQDYVLKQLTASLIYPEKGLGREFWNRVYTKARQMYGTSQIPINTFNKVWILPDQAGVFVSHNTAYVVQAHLKVMLDEDYLALEKHGAALPLADRNDSHSIGANIIRQIILPEIEHEVNTGKNFAPLRQVFYALILASWYKKNLKQALLNQVYADKNKINGVDVSDKAIKDKIYQQYLRAYKKGVFNFIKEDVEAGHLSIPRKYFSGGEQWAHSPAVDPAMFSNAADPVVHQALTQGPTGNWAMATVAVEKQDAAMANGLGNWQHWNDEHLPNEIGWFKRLTGLEAERQAERFDELSHGSRGSHHIIPYVLSISEMFEVSLNLQAGGEEQFKDGKVIYNILVRPQNMHLAANNPNFYKGHLGLYFKDGKLDSYDSPQEAIAPSRQQYQPWLPAFLEEKLNSLKGQAFAKVSRAMASKPQDTPEEKQRKVLLKLASIEMFEYMTQKANGQLVSAIIDNINNGTITSFVEIKDELLYLAKRWGGYGEKVEFWEKDFPDIAKAALPKGLFDNVDSILTALEAINYTPHYYSNRIDDSWKTHEGLFWKVIDLELKSIEKGAEPLIFSHEGLKRLVKIIGSSENDLTTEKLKKLIEKAIDAKQIKTMDELVDILRQDGLKYTVEEKDIIKMISVARNATDLEKLFNVLGARRLVLDSSVLEKVTPLMKDQNDLQKIMGILGRTEQKNKLRTWIDDFIKLGFFKTVPEVMQALRLLGTDYAPFDDNLSVAITSVVKTSTAMHQAMEFYHNKGINIYRGSLLWAIEHKVFKTHEDVERYLQQAVLQANIQSYKQLVQASLKAGIVFDMEGLDRQAVDMKLMVLLKSYPPDKANLPKFIPSLHALADLVRQDADKLSPSVKAYLADFLVEHGPQDGSYFHELLAEAGQAGIISLVEENRILGAESVWTINTDFKNLPQGHVGVVQFYVLGFTAMGSVSKMEQIPKPSIDIKWQHRDGSYYSNPPSGERYARARFADANGKIINFVSFLGDQVTHPRAEVGLEIRNGNTGPHRIASMDRQTFRFNDSDVLRRRNIKTIIEGEHQYHIAFLGYAETLSYAYYQIIESGAVFQACINAPWLQERIKQDMIESGADRFDALSLLDGQKEIIKFLKSTGEYLEQLGMQNVSAPDMDLFDEEFVSDIGQKLQDLLTERWKGQLPSLEKMTAAKIDGLNKKELLDLWQKTMADIRHSPQADNMIVDMPQHWIFQDFIFSFLGPRKLDLTQMREAVNDIGGRLNRQYGYPFKPLSGSLNKEETLTQFKQLFAKLQSYLWMPRLLGDLARTFSYNPVDRMQATGEVLGYGQVEGMHGVDHDPVFHILKTVSQPKPLPPSGTGQGPYVYVQISDQLSRKPPFNGRRLLMAQGATLGEALTSIGLDPKAVGVPVTQAELEAPLQQKQTITVKSKDQAMAHSPQMGQYFLHRTTALAPGGIDLNPSRMKMQVNGGQVDMRFNPAMIAQFKRGDFSGVRGVILKIVPLQSVIPLLGIK